MKEEITYDDFAKLDIRVAEIKVAEPVKGSEKLVRLELDLGELGERQILAGVAKAYSAESLVGKRIVIVANLAPREMMGIESQGMLLAANGADGPILLSSGDALPGATIQ